MMQEHSINQTFFKNICFYIIRIYFIHFFSKLRILIQIEKVANQLHEVKLRRLVHGIT